MCVKMRLMLRLLLPRPPGKAFLIRCNRCYSSSREASVSVGTVMSFGDGSHGALGLPSSSLGLGTDAYEPTTIPGLPNDIASIGAGHYHSLAVTCEGEVWAWGRNHEFQLGRSRSPSCLPCDSWSEPKKVQGLNEVRVKAVSASGVVSAAIGEDGSLWVWGKSKRGQLGLGKGILESPLPSRVHSLEQEHIIKVSFGWGHALACTKDGKLFGWGYSADGRLGRVGAAHVSAPQSREASVSSLDTAERAVVEQMEKEKDMPIIWEPALVQESHAFHVSDVACGLDHSLVLSSEGILISGGSNTYGQLGRSTEGSEMLPVEMIVKPLSISSGLGHSLAICQIPATEEHMGIFTWGWNRNSQLGRRGSDNVPMQVEGLEGLTPSMISGGRVHSIAVTSKGELWVWGCGKNGRLGLGSSADEDEPTLLESLQGIQVLQVVCGYDHNLVLVSPS